MATEAAHGTRPMAPDSPEVADRAAAWRSAYVHIPFCANRCSYCDFAVVTPGEAGRVVGGDPVARYVTALVAEIAMEPDWEPLDAVFFGGGTPSRLGAAQLGRVLTAVADRFGLRPGCEVTLEANPEDVSPEFAAAVLAVGVNRISLGVQALDPDVLAALGRRHSAEQGRAAVSAARAAGFASVAADVIFGTPGESDASWRRTVAGTLDLGADHLSTYALTVEPGTALSKAVIAGAPAPDPDDQAAKYEVAASLAAAAGLVRYEVSNYARPGHACRYNLAVWAQGEYVAFGLGAHGYRDGVRRRNLRRLDRFLEAAEAGRRPEAGRDVMDGPGVEQERLLLGIRRAAGVRIGRGGRRLLESAPGQRLLDAGVICRTGDRIVVRRPLLTDAASRAILEVV